MASPSEDTTTACLIDGTLLTNRSMSQLRLAAPLLTCRSFHLDRSSRSRRRAAVQPPLDLAGTPPGRSGSLPRPGPTRSNWSATRDPTGTTIRADEWEDWAFHPIRHRPGAVCEPQSRQGLPTPSDPKSSARGRGRASGQRWGGAGGHRARDWRRREPPAEVAAERAAAPDDAPAHGSPAAGGSEEDRKSTRL